MLSETDLKRWLHKELKQLDKLLLILATFDCPAKVTEIRTRSASAGLKMGSGWNPSSTLSKSKGLAIQLPEGWELTDEGKSHLNELGVSTISPAAQNVARDLRAHLSKVQNSHTRTFVEEAIKCHEHALYRSAIVMSWIAAVDVLHKHVVSGHLDKFNAESRRINGKKWKVAINADGLGRMNEEPFLNICASIGILGKNQKEELLKGLKLRNGCGHPNSLQVGPNAVAHHIENLLLNVFQPFSK